MKQAAVAVLLTAADGVLIHMQHATGGFSFGDPKCPCVGMAGLEGKTTVRLSPNVTAEYPADFAARCAAWDDARNSLSCLEGQEPGKGKGFCAEPWCFVDPCNCELDEPATKAPPTGYLPEGSYQGHGLWYSYKTCGGKDFWMSEDAKKKQQGEPKECKKKVDTKKWGNEKCRCIGLDNVPGAANVSIAGKEVPYPADAGATCDIWDAKRHPDCTGDKPPEWCKQAWCYVDPCECQLEETPKTSSYLPKGFGNGKPVYFSYAACGADDAFTKSNPTACVNQKSSGNCTKLEKCAWAEEKCVGKELVEVCGGAGRAAASLLALLALSALA
ncbi:unnamed protein product [Effrenium voratum]|uniref:Uncharacterized protein n=1 Tax=Effrenium voratum TaxID=2562239 RepID=A0AA36JIV6_9DINO|nr:unnamed protein product [Effrenium voratum]CAJ1449901.1 unnamed protein product [Effrenium voratum]